ncbi:MAG TPA: hypothetical protein VNN25_25130 [Thermoanaerobaculia bacterium]|nr:hypothetical protein [Thermoanaerobaculia bacterium]
MKRLASLLAITMAVITLPALAQARVPHAQGFASDFQTVPVMGNVPGIGSTFQTYVAILNPTSSAYSIQASLFDASGVRHDAVITLAAGELKTYPNFLDAVFSGFVGGGAVTFRSPDSAGGTRNNRFIIDTEVHTSGTRLGTSIPALEFAGTSSRSFSPGVTVGAASRTNIGCFDQSGAVNSIKATVLDSTGTQTLGTQTLTLGANAWGQTALTTIVSNGTVQFDPSDSAVCYAVVIDNISNDGRFVAASEYRP